MDKIQYMKENKNFVKGSRKANNYKYYPIGVGGVYFIKHDLTGHFYVGSSNDVNRRISHHFGNLNRGAHASRRFQEFYDKHSYNDFSYYVEEIADDEERNEKELEYLNLHKDNPLILNSSTENNSWVLNRANDQQVAEWKQKISYMAKQRTGEKNSFYGKQHSEETRQKIRDKHLGKTNEASYKPIVINGVFYKSLGEAHQKLGIPMATISHRITNKNKVFCNWYSFDEVNEIMVIDERLLFEPSLSPNGLFNIKGELFIDSKEICKRYNLKVGTLNYRLNSVNFPEWERII